MHCYLTLCSVCVARVCRCVAPTDVVPVVPDSYTGPRIEDEGVTLDFVMAMVGEFRVQRTLHKKYVVMILRQIHKILSETSSLMEVRVWVAAALRDQRSLRWTAVLRL